jgi:hypothetical protein
LPESIIILIHRNGDKTDCSNYRGISLLSTSYIDLFNMFLSSLSPHICEIIGDRQRGFRCNRTTTDQIFLHSLDTGEKMGVQWDTISAIHRLQGSL